MNSKEENSQEFCPNYAQEFGLCMKETRLFAPCSGSTRLWPMGEMSQQMIQNNRIKQWKRYSTSSLKRRARISKEDQALFTFVAVPL